MLDSARIDKAQAMSHIVLNALKPLSKLLAHAEASAREAHAGATTHSVSSYRDPLIEACGIFINIEGQGSSKFDEELKSAKTALTLVA